MDYDKESLADLLDYMEKTVCNVLSYTYAVSLMENEMSLVFWELGSVSSRSYELPPAFLKK